MVASDDACVTSAADLTGTDAESGAIFFTKGAFKGADTLDGVGISTGAVAIGTGALVVAATALVVMFDAKGAETFVSVETSTGADTLVVTSAILDALVNTGGKAVAGTAITNAFVGLETPTKGKAFVCLPVSNTRA